MNKIEREKKIIGLMIRIYCQKNHIKLIDNRLCAECDELLSYARQRLDKCPYGEKKSSCRKCKIHCYSPDKRERIREVMRYVGPRMLFVHPIAAIRHIISEVH